MSQAQTLLEQRNNRTNLIALAKLAAVKVFTANDDYDDATKFEFEDGSALVVEDMRAYVVK